MTKKRLTAKSYSPDSRLLAVWDDFTIYGFRMSLDGGVGECVIDLARTFGSDGKDYEEGNTVVITLSDVDTLASGSPDPGAELILYRGRIDEVKRKTGGIGGQVTISVLGEQVNLQRDILRNGSQTTLYSKATDGLTTTSGDQSAADIGEMARAVVDRHIAENPDTAIHYLEGDIPDIGIDATYTFEAMTCMDALDTLKGMAAGCHWFVRANGRLTFGYSSSTPTHTLTFGKEIVSAGIKRTAGGIANSWLIWDGADAGLYGQYEDAASIAKYGRRMAPVHVDAGIGDQGAMDAIGARLLAETSNPSMTVSLTVADSNGADDGYDIESILPGDTVRLLNFEMEVSEYAFNDNMTVTSVDWEIGQAKVEIEITPVGLIAQQRRQSKAIESIETRGIPESYT